MPEELFSSLILEKDVINGFSYSFSRALLEKLKELVEKKKVYQHLGSQTLTAIACAVSSNLSSQLFCEPWGKIMANQTEIDSLISTAEEFLAIFQKKSK